MTLQTPDTLSPSIYIGGSRPVNFFQLRYKQVAGFALHRGFKKGSHVSVPKYCLNPPLSAASCWRACFSSCVSPFHEFLEGVDGALVAAAEVVARALSAEGGTVVERSVRRSSLSRRVLGRRRKSTHAHVYREFHRRTMFGNVKEACKFVR